jgi:hydroxymethylglutaryl-CoA synthase
MALHAHRAALARDGPMDERAVRDSFERKVRGGLHLAARIGSAYGASNFVSLLGLLHTSNDLRPGDRISLFAYGSGCQAEMSCGMIGSEAVEQIRALDLDTLLDARRALSLHEYHCNEEAREAMIDRPDCRPERELPAGVYAGHYEGRKLLVLERVEAFRRHYAVS